MQIIGLAGPAQAGKNAVSDALVANYGFVRYAFADPLYEEVIAAFNLDEDTAKFLMDPTTKEQPSFRLTLNKCKDNDFVNAALLAGARYHNISGWSPTEAARSPRQILQIWGTEYRRGQNEDYWIDKADMFLTAWLSTLQGTITQEIVDQERTKIQLEQGITEVSEDMLPKVGQHYIKDAPGLVIEDVRFQNEEEWIRSMGGNLWHVERSNAPSIGDAEKHVSARKMEPKTGDKLFLNYGTLGQLATGVGLALQGNDIVNTRPES